MVKVTKYNSAQEILANKTADELIRVWKDSQKRKEALMFNPAQVDRSEEWDALIQVRIWIAAELQKKLTDEEFIDVVDA
jgi:hypothetical protein